MRRAVVLLVLAAAGWWGSAAGAADEPGLDDLRRRTLAAEDQRYRRALELARVTSELGRLEDARRLYEEALAVREDDMDVVDALLGVLCRLGDTPAQLPLVQRLSSSRPGDVKLRMQLGECLWRLKRTDEARKTWDVLLKRFPAERVAYDDLVDFYMAEGYLEDARDILRQRRERFGEDAQLLLTEAALAVAAKTPSDALPPLLRCLELDLSENESRRAEFLLFLLARETGKAADVGRELAASLANVQAQLAGRWLGLADDAAGRKDFAAAAALAERALPLLTDPARRTEVSSRVAAWRAAAPK